MVFVVREQPPKRSKLSLFRLGKSSLPSKSINMQTASLHEVHPRVHVDDYDLPPLPYSSPSSVQVRRSSDRSDGTDQVGYRQPFGQVQLQQGQQQSHSVDDEQQHSDNVYYQNHNRSGSLPLQSKTCQPISSIPPNVLFNVQQATAHLAAKHARQRSHFSIPDVVVTSCEEEGEKTFVELKVPHNKRRINKPSGGHPLSNIKHKKKASARRPVPLIQIDIDNQNGNARSNKPSGSGDSYSSPTLSSSPTSSLGSFNFMSSKKSRRPSFPLLFGRRNSVDSKSPTLQQHGFQEIVPPSPAFSNVSSSDHAASLVGISEEASPDRIATGKPDYDVLPSPPATPTKPTLSFRPLSKKQIKAKEKQELSLIKELEKVDKMVRQYDAKAQKEQQKQQAKERKRQQQQTQTPSIEKASDNAFKRITIFSAARKAGPNAGLGRRSSGVRRKDGATLPNGSPSSKTKELSTLAEAPTECPPSPTRTVVTAASPAVTAAARSSSPVIPVRKTSTPLPQVSYQVACVPAVDRAANANVNNSNNDNNNNDNNSDEIDRTHWQHPSWSGFENPLTGTLTSLVQNTQETTSTSNTTPPLSLTSLSSSSSVKAKLLTDLASASDGSELPISDDQGVTRLTRRSSVQRALALADAEEMLLRKRASLRRRGSTQRSTNHRVGSTASSKTSSIASLKHRSFIRQLDALQDWKVVDDNVNQVTDRSTVNLAAADWVDSDDTAASPSNSQETVNAITTKQNGQATFMSSAMTFPTSFVADSPSAIPSTKSAYRISFTTFQSTDIFSNEMVAAVSEASAKV